jgi:uncharacterized protein
VPNVIVRPARIGHGLFTTRAFEPGETIVRIHGRIVHYSILWKRGGTFLDNCIRFGPETYLDPGDDPGRYVNHSCVPNAGIRKERNRLFLFAATRIGAGREITFDYSTTIGDDDVWTMRCGCGRSACRRRIRRFGSLPGALQERYLALGMVPRYIADTVDR